MSTCRDADYPWANAIASAAVLLTFAMEYTLGNVFRSRFASSGLSPQGSATLTAPVQVPSPPGRLGQMSTSCENFQLFPAPVSKLEGPSIAEQLHCLLARSLQGGLAVGDPEAAASDIHADKTAAVARLNATIASYSLVRCCIIAAAFQLVFVLLMQCLRTMS